TTSEIKKTNSEIINIYHGLSRIEDSFRITKSDLVGRPVYARKEEHTNAHFLICFIALTIIRLLQHKFLLTKGKETKMKTKKESWDKWWISGITADALKNALDKWSIDGLSDGFFRASKPTNQLTTLLESLGVITQLRLPNWKEISAFRQEISQALSL
ncbi:MAG: transposase, partial [Candidatus Ancillula sp.]|nr:transposase [Candidatus Ancillula sp.]